MFRAASAHHQDSQIVLIQHGPPDDEHLLLVTCRGVNKYTKKECLKLVITQNYVISSPLPGNIIVYIFVLIMHFLYYAYLNKLFGSIVMLLRAALFLTRNIDYNYFCNRRIQWPHLIFLNSMYFRYYYSLCPFQSAQVAIFLTCIRRAFVWKSSATPNSSTKNIRVFLQSLKTSAGI
jgi:hypothetical protein